MSHQTTLSPLVFPLVATASEGGDGQRSQRAKVFLKISVQKRTAIFLAKSKSLC
jgi:hypothetical protein